MDERTVFRQRMETELHQWEAELDRWQNEDEHADGATELRREQQQMLDELHSKRLRARQYLDQVQQDADWAALKPKMEQLWAAIRAQISTIETWT